MNGGIASGFSRVTDFLKKCMNNKQKIETTIVDSDSEMGDAAENTKVKKTKKNDEVF